ncbi:MAG TPA: hypothetical protein VGI46_10835 [Candidatus Acidoferrum sp.]
MTLRTKLILLIGIAASLTLSISAAPRAQEKDKAPAKKIAIRAGRLIDGKSDTPILNAVILIEGDKIISVSAAGTAPAGYELLDLSKATVLPGFADVHTHVLLNGDIHRGGLRRANFEAIDALSRDSCRTQRANRAGQRFHFDS